MTKVERLRVEEEVGLVVGYHSAKDTWDIHLYEQEDNLTYTTEALRGTGLFLGDDIEKVYTVEDKEVCVECKNEPMKDEVNGEMYCPVCDSE